MSSIFEVAPLNTVNKIVATLLCLLQGAHKTAIKEYKIIATHLPVVHRPCDGSEISKGDLDRRVPQLGPVGGGAGALLQQAGADRPGWLGPWQEEEQEQEQDGGQVGGHRGQPMGPLMARRITLLPEKVASLTALCSYTSNLFN